ncbi:MAG: FkbM family methyltransferase [Nitrospinota bacterium]
MKKRPSGRLLKAFFNKPFYSALINIFKNFHHPINVFRRYVFEKGAYPHKHRVTTPLGNLEFTLYSFHDMITLVECFGKLDYQAGLDITCVVDMGSNIGISAGYFLTRNKNVKVYLFEPLPENISKLKANLKGFENRFELNEVAVGMENGTADFGFEKTGRYGGLQANHSETIPVQVRRVEEILSEILEKEGRIDILKIDVEGLETEIIESLTPDILKNIDRIYAETNYPGNLPGFKKEQYGGVVRFRKS